MSNTKPEPSVFPWSAPCTGPWFEVGSDRVRLLVDGRDAFPTMLAAIRHATSEILLEMYWVGDDDVGRTFRAALTEAANNGVIVKVVVDAIGSLGLPSDFWAPLERAGGIAHTYHPLSPFAPTFRLTAIDRRDHRKLLLVDGKIGFVGGINLATAWIPKENGGLGFRDDAIELTGPVTFELRSLFYKTWQHLTAARPPKDVLPVVPGRTRNVWALASQTSRRMRRGILGEYLFRIQRAERNIDLANAYFVPDGSFRHALYGARRRGVRVRLLVPRKGDIAVVQMAQESLYTDLLARGFEVYLLRDTVLHSKTAIVDEKFVTTGSYNFDERSRTKNLELNIAVEDAAFASHTRRAFETDLLAADRLTDEAWRERGRLRRATEVVSYMLRRFW